MKKASILLILICSLSFNACAQWYLFPGKKKQADPPKTAADSTRRAKPDSARVQPGADTLAVAPADSSAVTEPETFDEPYVLDRPDVIHIGLALPLQASAQRPSDNFLDFYSGALLALRDLGAAGLRADLQVLTPPTASRRSRSR